MKKVLVAGAALMIAGSANAGVNISGDARVTYVGNQDYVRTANDANGYDDYFESRVGLNVDAKSDKGVGAKARFYFDDAGFESPAIWDGAETVGATVDYAYLNAPVGENWTIRAGRVNPNFSKFFSWNIRPTRLMAIYENKEHGMTLIPFIGVKKEVAGSVSDEWNDKDYMEYALVTTFKMPTGWTLKTYARYNDDQREKDEVASLVDGVDAVTLKDHRDRSGFDGSINIASGPDCMIGFEAEFSYKAADVQGTVDDGMGGFVLLSKKVSETFTPAVVAGMTKDGFVADNDFGFVMVGGNDFTQVMNVGQGGDLLFGAFVANVKVSDQFTLTGNLLYADFDNEGAGTLDSAVEVSGVASYALSNGANLTYKLGYLTPSVNNGGSGSAEDAYLGHLLRLDFTF